jgi:hypothetical protein
MSSWGIWRCGLGAAALAILPFDLFADALDVVRPNLAVVDRDVDVELRALLDEDVVRSRDDGILHLGEKCEQLARMREVGINSPCTTTTANQRSDAPEHICGVQDNSV